MLRQSIQKAILVSFALSGCSSESPPQGLQGGQPAGNGIPTSGGNEALAGPTDAQVHESRVKSVLAKSGLAGESEFAKWRAAPLVEARVEYDKGSFEGRWVLSGVNDGTEALRSVAFELPANRATGRPAMVTLKGVKVAGVDVSAGGTTARWEVPVDVAPGKRFEMELVFAGTLPRARVEAAPKSLGAGASGVAPQGKIDLSALLGQVGNTPELRRLVPVVPVIDGAAAAGQYEGVAVLAGCLPVLAQGMKSVGVLSLEVLAASELAVDATGRRIGSERDGTRLKQRFVALGAGDIAIVLSRGLGQSDAVVADVPVTLRVAQAAAADLTAQLRRALDELQTRWGNHGPAQLTVTAVDGIGQGGKDGDAAVGPGVASLPEILLVPATLLEATKTSDPNASAGGRAPAPGLSLSGMLGAMIENHPAAREALAFAIATAVAQQWWLGVGDDDAVDNVLRQGFARAGALAIVSGKGGDKAERRALEFGLRLPIQLALEQGNDIALAGVSRANGAHANTLAALKAGLFVDALARHIGEPTMVALVQRMFAVKVAGPLTLEMFRNEVLALAPRLDETRAFLVRWLDETHLSEDVGPLRPEVLLEYFVADGAIGSLTSQLMGQLGPDKLGGKALELIASGKELDAGMALSLLGDLAGNNVDPSIKKWLTLGTGLLGGGDGRKSAVDGLVDMLGAELGIPETDRSRLRQLSTLLIHELSKGDDHAVSPPVPPAPPSPQIP